MESINNSEFDVVIVGTGLSQSLLALALSRSEKKILHIDPNDYYGGPNAALSLQDAEAWVKHCNEDSFSGFRKPQISKPEFTPSTSEPAASKLGFSRAYSLALSPQIVYSRSALLPTLVSSKVHNQLEFLAVGAWWIYEGDADADTTTREASGTLKRIPGRREDVFADKSIDLKAKRSLMKFLKTVADTEAQPGVLADWGEKSVEEYLSEGFGISGKLLHTLHALTLSPHPPCKTKISFALPRITRHLTSIGVFGPGFGAVIAKWGGLAEIAQVSCRACAVGGGVYMLSRGFEQSVPPENPSDLTGLAKVELTGSESVRTSKLAGAPEDLRYLDETEAGKKYTARAITIVSSPLAELFPPITEGGSNPSACTVTVFPEGSLRNETGPLPCPLYLMIHSSDTGECPAGQCVIYSSVTVGETEKGLEWLDLAVKSLIRSLQQESDVQMLWQLNYYQHFQDPQEPVPRTDGTANHILPVPPLNNTDLAFDDSVLWEVRHVWQAITGETDGFLQFEERETGAIDDDYV